MHYPEKEVTEISCIIEYLSEYCSNTLTCLEIFSCYHFLISPQITSKSQVSSFKCQATMVTSFQVAQLDLSCYSLPLKAFVGGQFVDSVGHEKHTLISAVNDDVVTTGINSPM